MNNTTNETGANGTEIALEESLTTMVVSWMILPMFVLALFGNVLIVMVMNKPHNRKLSSSTYFSALAISDMLLVTQGSMERWVIHVVGFNIYNYLSPLEIKVRISILFANFYFSVWTLIAITVDRLICVTLPHRSKVLCNTFKAKSVVALICMLCLLASFIPTFCLINLEFIVNEGMIQSEAVPNGQIIIILVDLTIAFLLPFTIITIGTVLILITLQKSEALSKSSSASSRTLSATRNLLCANIMYVVSFLPFHTIDLLALSGALSNTGLDIHSMVTVAMFFRDSNAVFNFYIYVLSGARFRNDVKRLLCTRGLDPQSSSSKSSKSNFTTSDRVSSVKY